MPAFAYECPAGHETTELFHSWRDRTRTIACATCGVTATYSIARSATFTHPPEFFPYVSTAHGEYVTSRNHLKQLDRKAGVVPLEGQMRSKKLQELHDKGQHQMKRGAR